MKFLSNKVLCFFLIGAFVVLAVSFRKIAFPLLFGWITYLRRVLPDVTIRWDAVLVFAVGLVIFAVIFHQIAAWLRREMSEQAATWRWRSTMLVIGVIVVMFVAGVAMVGATHQVTWLATSKSPIWERALPESPEGSKRNLTEIGLGLDNFHDTYRAFPTSTQTPPQGWVVRISPYLWLDNPMDLDKPWDHADNRHAASKLIPMLLNPGIRPLVTHDNDGYGITHYVANKHLFDGSSRVSKKDLVNGESQTIMIGEINANFPPWAKPRTGREPELGINQSPQGFGGPNSKGGALLLMADGSVKFFSRATDPEVLKKLNGVEQ